MKQAQYAHISPWDDVDQGAPSLFFTMDLSSIKYAVVVSTPTNMMTPVGDRSIKWLGRFFGDDMEKVYITTLVNTPLKRGKRPTAKMIKVHGPRLIKELQLVNPDRVLVLGGQVAKYLCPGFKNLNADHGTIFFNPDLDAYVVPTYHLSTLGGRDPNMIESLLRDIDRFMTITPVVPEYEEVYSNYQPSAPLKIDDLTFVHEDEVILDIETTSLDPRDGEILSIGFKAIGEHNTTYVLMHPSQQDLIDLYYRFKLSNVKLIGHHFQFDLYFLMEKSKMYWDLEVGDTMMLAYIRGDEALSLKHLTSLYTNRPGSHAYGGPEDLLYLVEDVLSTEAVYNFFTDNGETKPPFVYDLLCNLIPHTVAMRRRGVHIDRKQLVRTMEHYHRMVNEQIEDLGATEVNWNSPSQVADFLVGQGVKLKVRTASGQLAVNEPVLRQYAKKYPVVQKILDYRETAKILTFLEGYDSMTTTEDPILRPRFIMHGTSTGRPSCQDPNLQNVPREGPVKDIFVPRDHSGLYGLVDLSQAELRVAALLSNDERFAEMLMSDDAHRKIASSIFNKAEEDISPAERKKSKGVTFGLLYGGSPKGLAGRVGVPVHEVELILKNFFDQFPVLTKWIEEVKYDGITKLEVLSPMGRRRDFKALMSFEGERSVERKAINTPIQGTASDIMLMILLHTIEGFRDQRLSARPLICIHDSELMEILDPDELVPVHRVVQSAFVKLLDSPLGDLPLSSTLPIVGELVIGSSWASVESTHESYDPMHIFDCSSLPHLLKGTS